MNAKEIGRKAGQIFGHQIPASWIYRSQEDQEDYGVDGEIELTDSSDHATGFIFKVQIKGNLNATFIHNGKTLAIKLKTERLKYYMQEVEIPISLVVVDISTERIYWTSLQNDANIKTVLKLAIENNTEHVTVHIPAANVLAKDGKLFLASVEDNMNWLRLTATTRMTKPIESLICHSDEEVLSKLFDQKKHMSFALYSETFDRLYLSGKYDELVNTAGKVLNSNTESLETRFCAGIYIARVFESQSIDKPESSEQAHFELFAYLQTITRQERGEERLRMYSTLLLRSILLSITTEQDFHHYVSAESSKNNELTAWVVAQSRSRVIIRASGQVQKTIHLMNRMVFNGHYYVFLDSLPRISGSLTMFAQRLALDGLNEQSEFIYKWLKKCIDMAVLVAIEFKEDLYLAQTLMLNAYFRCNLEDAESYYEESITKASYITDEQKRDGVIESILELKESEPYNPKKMTAEEELIFFQKRAKSLGFDYENPDDEIGKIINQGLKDYNPERVIRNCEHLMVFPSRAQGIPAQVVGLQSAAMKWLYCLKTKNAHGGWSLDDIYTFPVGGGFKEKHCDGCKHKSPRPVDWKWDSEWQDRQIIKHMELIKKLDQF